MFDEKKEWKKIRQFVERNPTTNKLLMVGVVVLFGAWMFSMATYVPPEPQPVMTVWGFFDFLNTVELPSFAWVVILFILWLTKWR